MLERGRDGGEWEGVRASIFMCMGIWLESLAVGEDLIQALFGFIPAAVQAIVAEGGQVSFLLFFSFLFFSFLIHSSKKKREKMREPLSFSLLILVSFLPLMSILFKKC